MKNKSNYELIPTCAPVWRVPFTTSPRKNDFNCFFFVCFFFKWRQGRKGGLCIQHHYLVPPLVHPWTYQVRPFTVPLLYKRGHQMEIFFKRKKARGDFSLHAEVSITLIFFSIDGRRRKKKQNWCCGNEGYHRAWICEENKKKTMLLLLVKFFFL